MTLVRPDDWRPQGVEELEPKAWEALRETGRSVCVTAGAGAGKTEFLAQKAAYLLQTGICPAPKRILAISFKRDAAQNLALRVQKRCPPLQSRRFNSMTFDAFNKHLLDQFRPAIPAPYAPPRSYRIVFPARRDFEEFLRRSSGGLNARQMERLVARTPLPILEAELSEPRRVLLDAYWTEQYEYYDEALLSFPMINRLAEFLIRTNPQVKKALQLTYRFVFIDEFQDTTFAQFGLVKTAFSGSDAIFTAVGDDKQRIMGWADAMPDAFDQFTAEFDAKPFSLVLNCRSHEELVAIQRVIAHAIDPKTVPVHARGTRTVHGEISAIWDFEDREQEATQLAAWIRAEIDAGTIAPHDVAILVRMNANIVEEELQPAFSDLDLIIRNVARNVGSIAIQDLLSEDFTSILFPILRLGASGRDPKAWTDAQASLRLLHALSDDDDTGQQRLQLSLQQFTRDFRQFMRDNPPQTDSAREIAARALAFVREDLLRQAFPAYGRDADFQRVREGFDILLAECTELSDSWPETLDRFEGLGQVSLMTVHKSKSLEFHTMIFFGLDNNTWWSLVPDRSEELNSFFVAFTRAEQRAFFTSCAERGNTIDWIDEVLVPAGVKHIPGADIV
jgi:superfamily I DNA/RNA helicase